MQKIIPCLWFDNNAEEAVRFYCSVFKKSKIGAISYYDSDAPGPEGTVLTIQFWLNGQEYLALNGGPIYKFTEAISLMVMCETQAEIDYYWEKLSKGAQKVECGWLKDKFGLSWQITPSIIVKMISDKDRARAGRVLKAVRKMKKLDIKALKKAYAKKA